MNCGVNDDFDPRALALRCLVVKTAAGIPSVFSSADPVRFASSDGLGVGEYYRSEATEMLWSEAAEKPLDGSLDECRRDIVFVVLNDLRQGRWVRLTHHSVALGCCSLSVRSAAYRIVACCGAACK